MAVELTWLGHASFRITGSAVVYVDPWKLDEQPQGDVIAVSHSHYDHLSVDDVKALAGPGTQVVAAADCTGKLDDLSVRAIAPGEAAQIGSVGIEAIPAYNPNKEFHPRANNWLGFVISLDGQRIYYAGDTDLIPEMSDLTDIDLALLPVGGTYTMTAQEAAEATTRFSPRMAVPYHWGDIVGDENDAKAFHDAAACAVTILQPGESLMVD